MSRLFVFGIGGTGSRVIKALTFLLASGVKIYNNFNEIVPIIIDPDKENGDFSLTINILNNYLKIRSFLSSQHFEDKNIKEASPFFAANIKRITEYSQNKSKQPSFQINIEELKNVKLKEIIQYSELSFTNKLLVQLLYSEKNLMLDELTKGFLGNPNVGSIVLNNFQNNEEFKTFADSFNVGDRIFIISSIFGGTGAAGFPLLVKTIRDSEKSALKEAKIGALTVLPYFNLNDDEESNIDSNNFIPKTIAALNYYENNLFKNNQVNAIYFIGDALKKVYKNNEGGAEQRNPANLIELLSAYGIIDFANKVDNDFAERCLYHEYALENINEEINFNDLGDKTRRVISKPIIKLLLAKKIFDYYISEKHSHQYVRTIPINEKLIFEVDVFKKFLMHYYVWLKEMSENVRSFAPFNLNTNDMNLLLKEYIIKPGFLDKGIDDNYIIKTLNKAADKLNGWEPVQKLYGTIVLATETIYNKYFSKF